jgi:hypothetical protein
VDGAAELVATLVDGDVEVESRPDGGTVTVTTGAGGLDVQAASTAIAAAQVAARTAPWIMRPG